MSQKKSSNSFIRELREKLSCEVAGDELSCGLYATDASIYEIFPRAVVIPQTDADVLQAVECARKHGVPILPRGGGTSLGGQAVCPGMILDFTTHLRRVLELNVTERWVRVEPGIVLEELNEFLKPYGLKFGPDPATGNRAAVGGMIGNNASGGRSLIYGLTKDNVLETKVLLSDGTQLRFRELSPEEYAEAASRPDREGEILCGFRAIVNNNLEEIKHRYPTLDRRVQGYNLDAFRPGEPWNLSHLVCGSEGTLGIVLEAKLKLVPIPGGTALCALHFHSLPEALKLVQTILRFGPSAVELIDKEVISCARRSPAVAGQCGFIQDDPAAVLIVEFIGENPKQAAQKAEALASGLGPGHAAYAAPVITDPAGQEAVWNVRKSGLGVLLAVKGDRKPVPFIEDTCVPVEALPQYVERISSFCRKRNVPLVVYAHAGAGTLHLRPLLNLKDPRDIQLMKEIAEYAFELIKALNGSWSGEHGDGRVRSPFLERYFGPRLYAAFRETKKLFDPQGLMNPGVIVDPKPMEADLRFGPGYRFSRVSTAYHFRKEGSFQAAVELCNGVGACRQTLTGVMCPSFRATRKEFHTTRARANALRLACSGRLKAAEPFPAELEKVMDLCLSCKACKAECPSAVDMARLKSEFLFQRHSAAGASLREKMVAASPRLAALAAGWKAPFVNAVQRNALFRFLLEKIAGFDRRRVPPSYARLPFYKWFRKNAERFSTGRKTVVLFDDTYMNFYEPSVGIAASELLSACGYRVVLARAGCCQRPRISHGFLKEAKRDGEKTLRNLDRFIQQGLPVVVCEPGCASALVDDLPDLIEDEALGERIRRGVFMLDVFLARELREGALQCRLSSPFERVLVHGHCHQRSLFGTTAMEEILRSIPHLSFEILESGCCGMAGSFGYEKEHYELSLQIGEQRLFPAVRSAPPGTAVVACGFSCRHQIRDGTGVRAYHLAEILKAGLR